MALFGKKKKSSEGDDEVNEDQIEATSYTPQPEKATKWFAHARTMADSANFETALVYYASGLRFDPQNQEAINAMLQVGIKHSGEGGKRISSKAAKSVEGPEPVDKMAVAILYWMSDLQNSTLGIKALEAICAAEQHSTGRILAAHVLSLVRRGKKPTKQQFVTVKDLCKELHAWDEALAAGHDAIHLDPSDGSLDHEIKDITAQRAMAAGGYEEDAGTEGGFRKFIKDADKQREIEEEESLAGAGGGSERAIARAKERFLEAPDIAENVNRYGTMLRREGTTESLVEAEKVFMKGFKSTNEYRFRMTAGDIRMQRFRTRIQSLEADDSSDAADRLATLQNQLLEFEESEYRERAERYPTDRAIRFHLGEVAFRRGDTDTAMGCFQKSKDEPRLRAASGHLLGRCFAAEGWHGEAVAEFEDVLAKIDATEADRELEVRYDLMCSLIELATSEQSQDHAKAALDICSGIARKDISYRDIRDRRRQIDDLVRSMN